ncbi:MAG: ABC transporter ATP-binding protein [Candidatus Neomarinimicrobiota bacterium]|tara:strand:+ start:703 stop:1683 length:981 start_codon:yes stop_codon:yes gene_type:complete
MLQTEGLSKCYGHQNVLTNFNLNIESGEIISVVGSSGSGKTTLLRLISGLEMPDNGQITLKNEIVNSSNIFIRPEDRDCSLVFQDYALFPNMSMRQNIYFGKNSINNKEKIEELIEITEIKSIMEKFPHQCSGGEQQRVALVRSLAINPSLVLMDEPLSNLDQSLKANMALVIRKLLKKFKITAIIVTHDITDAMEMSDRIVVIDKGEVMQDGLPNELYNNPQSKNIALLFGETNFIPLEMFPKSKNKFFDAETKKDWVSIRPNQFSLYDEDLATGKKVFVGKIVSIREVASEHKIKLECKDLSLKVSLSSQIELAIGKELKLMAP